MTSFNGQKKEEEVKKCRRENAKIRLLDAHVYVEGGGVGATQEKKFCVCE